MAPDGTLFATDLLGDAVFTWAPPDLPNDFVRWTLIETSGPWRVSVGAQEDGTVLVIVPEDIQSLPRLIKRVSELMRRLAGSAPGRAR